MSFFSNLTRTVRTNFSLRKHQPLPSTLSLLKELYPNVNWSRVDFYEGLPWYTKYVAPYVTAQALPSFYSFHKFRIYLTKYDESRAQCLADIVHEAMHVMQAMKYGNGYGVGFLRGFIIFYLSLFFKYGYRQNPFEIPAYDQEYRFLYYCETKKQHGVYPKIDMQAITPVDPSSGLIFYNSNVKYGENIFWLTGGFILTLIIALFKPVIDCLVFPLKLMRAIPQGNTGK